jgi:hypothetical protein
VDAVAQAGIEPPSCSPEPVIVTMQKCSSEKIFAPPCYLTNAGMEGRRVSRHRNSFEFVREFPTPDCCQSANLCIVLSGGCLELYLTFSHEK